MATYEHVPSIGNPSKIEIIPPINPEQIHKEEERMAENRKQEDLRSDASKKITEEGLARVRNNLQKHSAAKSMMAAAMIAIAGMTHADAGTETNHHKHRGEHQPEPIVQKESFFKRMNRTFFHVGESLTRNTTHRVLEDARGIKNAPAELGEAIMGRDFKKHEDIGPTKRFSKLTKAVLDGGIPAAEIATGPVGALSEIGRAGGMGGLVDTGVEYIAKKSPHVKAFQDEMKKQEEK